MPFPSFDTFFVPIVHSLRARGGSATIDELEEAVASAANLSEEERSQPHGDGPRTEFSYRLAWARTYLKRGGALDNSERGVWRLTPAGNEMSDEQIREIKYLVQQQDRDARAAAAAEAEAEPEEGNEVEDIALSWKERLLEALLAIEPSAFERLLSHRAQWRWWHRRHRSTSAQLAVVSSFVPVKALSRLRWIIGSS